MNPNNENYEQNGGLPSLSARNALPVEYKNKDNVCRDYVWGKCTKVQCKFVHECDLQVMLNILHFCHDYQNCTGCKRTNCTFLHATREEEKLFREEGQFPADLVKRHSQMHAALASMSRKYEESYKNKPPPPPLENQQALPQMLMVNPMYQTAPRWFLQPPPPPPPPPREPSPPPPHYSGPPPPAPGPSSAYHGQSVLPPPAAAPAPAYSQPIVPHQIDTSKPPPPFLMQHVHVKRLPDAHEGSPPKVAATPYATQPVPDTLSPDVSKPPPPLFPAALCSSSILGKRVHPDSYDASEAGPIRRISSNSQSSSCENCTRWDLRALLIEKKLREHIAEKACAVLKYEEKKTEVGNIVELLGCLTAPQSDPSNSVSDISTPLDETLLRALVANHIKEKPNFVPKHSMNSVLRRITDIIKDSDACSSSTTNGNITQGLERLLDIDLDLHRPEPSGQPPASVPPPHNFPNTVVSTHAPVPPMPQQFTQAYRPMQHHNYQFPGGPSNGAAEVLNKPPTTNAPMQPAPLLPPYNSDHNSCYMMGRPPPPFQ